MNPYVDNFKPYSHELKGDLVDYLMACENADVSNLFSGVEDFFEIKKRKLLIPGRTCLRIDQSPVPDIVYFVNEDFLLESRGSKDYNMSAISAKKGIHSPEDALKNKFWGISDLNLFDRLERID